MATMKNTVLSPKAAHRVAILPTKNTGLQIQGVPTSKPRLATVVRSSEVEGDVSVETMAAKDVCKTCGVPLSEIPFGCDQSGRIQGGIGAVPGTYGCCYGTRQ